MRLIDADALKEHIKLQTDFLRLINEPTMNEIAQTVEEGFLAEVDIATTIDAEPVVRCKDCKHRDDGFCTGRGYPNVLVPDDGFCDKGDRSKDGWRE